VTRVHSFDMVIKPCVASALGAAIKIQSSSILVINFRFCEELVSLSELARVILVRRVPGCSIYSFHQFPLAPRSFVRTGTVNVLGTI